VRTAGAEAEESKKKSVFLKYFQKMLTDISIKLLVQPFRKILDSTFFERNVDVTLSNPYLFSFL
jgi:hypothetical protein